MEWYPFESGAPSSSRSGRMVESRDALGGYVVVNGGTAALRVLTD